MPKRNLHTAVAEHIVIAGQERHMWGYVDYTQPMTEEEIEEYELVPGGTTNTDE